MDRQVYWNELCLNPVETQSLENYLPSPGGTNMSYANSTSQESASLSMWNSAAPSSSEHPQNQGNHDETKMENAWTASLAGNGGGGPRIEERRSEAVNTLSLGNVTINLNNYHMDNSQPAPQSSNSYGIPQNFDDNVGHVGTSSQAPEAGLCPPYNTGSSESEHALSSGVSSNTCGNSSRGVGIFLENGDGRPGGSLDGRRACKRKNIEGVPEQESANGSSSFFRQTDNSFTHSVSHHNPNTSLNISRTSDFLSGLSPSAQLNSRIDTTVGASDSLSGSVSGNAESSQRILRMRINPTHQHDTVPPNPWAQGNTTALSNVWATNQSSPPTPFSQPLESRPVVAGASSHSALHIPVNPRLPQNVQPWNGASSTRIGSSPSNPIIVGERLMASREETNSRSIPRINTSDLSAFVPVVTDTRQLVPVPPNWASDGTASIPGSVVPASRAGTSSGVHQLRGPTWASHHIPPPQYPRNLSEIVRRSLFLAGSAANGGHGVNFIPERPSPSATSQDIGRSSGAALRGHPHAYMRSAVMMDRQRDGVPGIPVGVGRSRMISELRNMIDLMRRGENVRLEDIFFDHAFFFGGGDLLDRHRDMRLDVDNMSYEELLALEERIGDVSTGLSEETVMECLKQCSYVSVTVEESAEVEPCCICQEEYVDGDALGRLDCGHDFHTPCIKQWLMQKNTCPICKTTALATPEN